MPRYAELDGTKIINVFIADEVFIAEHKPHAIECPEDFGTGDKYEDGEFSRVTVTVSDDGETL